MFFEIQKNSLFLFENLSSVPSPKLQTWKQYQIYETFKTEARKNRQNRARNQGLGVDVFVIDK